MRRLAERLQAEGVIHNAEGTRKMAESEFYPSSFIIHTFPIVLCLSPNALASGWVALERSTAIHRDPSNEGRRFIPLLLADCDLPDTLRRYKYVDFREEAKAAFAEVHANLLAKLLSGKLRVAEVEREVSA